MVGFCAVVLRKQINLLPPNKNTATQTKLAGIYANTYILHDGCNQLAASIPAFNLEELNLSELKLSGGPRVEHTPLVGGNQLAAISFTSGSTGDSKPNLKYWDSLKVSSNINSEHMLGDLTDTLHMVATVPAQHMWGLETSVFLPLHHKVCILDTRPFYPQDVLSDLALLPKPRGLITTPAHLRSLQDAHLELPEASLVLSATSPLPQALAQAVERSLKSKLLEVYGCSEVGSMAVRKTASETLWQLFRGISFKKTGCNTLVTAAHLPHVTTLEDQITLIGPSQFELGGRSDDSVEIAGKRGSLLEINQVLQQFPGLIDGLVFMPPKPPSSPGIKRLVAIVSLKPGVDKALLRAYFREHLDSAFVPRPIFKVDKIEREESGKLPKAKIHQLYRSITEPAMSA